MRVRHPDCYTFPGSQAHQEQGEKKKIKKSREIEIGHAETGDVESRVFWCGKSNRWFGSLMFSIALDLFFHIIINSNKLCD